MYDLPIPNQGLPPHWDVAGSPGLLWIKCLFLLCWSSQDELQDSYFPTISPTAISHPLPCPCPITAPNSPKLHRNPYSANAVKALIPLMPITPLPHPCPILLQSLQSVSHSEKEALGGLPLSEVTGALLLA